MAKTAQNAAPTRRQPVAASVGKHGAPRIGRADKRPRTSDSGNRRGSQRPSSMGAPRVEREPDGRFKQIHVNFHGGPDRLLSRGTMKGLYLSLVDDAGELARELLSYPVYGEHAVALPLRTAIARAGSGARSAAERAPQCEPHRLCSGPDLAAARECTPAGKATGRRHPSSTSLSRSITGDAVALTTICAIHPW